MMFSNLKNAPEDPILGLTEAFVRDTNPKKINLGAGIYKDAKGKTPVLESVKLAEKRLIETEVSKSYLPMQGDAAYCDAVQTMMFGRGHAVLTDGRALTAHTPGGTGALRVAGDYLKQSHAGACVWLPTPTWANHPSIFNAAGVETKSYAYFEENRNGINFDAMITSLKKIPAGDVVLLHGCCQNPTGADPEEGQWQIIADTLSATGAVPLVDLAYQGFGTNLDADAEAVRVLGNSVPEMFVCSSYSKNFSLYNERVGGLTVVGGDAENAARAMGHVKLRIRTNYSNPPAHGAAIVSTILGDAGLTQRWMAELDTMRERIAYMRTLFVSTLKSIGVKQDFSFLTQQKGMFSFSGLTPAQVKTLRDKHSIYIVGSGRISVAGMTEANMGPLCAGIKDVL